MHLAFCSYPLKLYNEINVAENCETCRTKPKRLTLSRLGQAGTHWRPSLELNQDTRWFPIALPFRHRAALNR
jgi:hypothetical protein